MYHLIYNVVKFKNVKGTEIPKLSDKKIYITCNGIIIRLIADIPSITTKSKRA